MCDGVMHGNFVFDKCVFWIYKKISKKDYLNKQLIQIANKKKKYLSMTDDQFLTIYIEMHSNYERKKGIFIVTLVGLMIIIITDVWEHCFDLFQGLLLSENDIIVNEVAEVELFIFFLTMTIFIFVLSVILIILNRFYKLNKEILLLDEVKAIRNKI